MKGRLEHELTMENKIKELIEYSPSYMKNYYQTILNKSYTTQNTYIRYVIDFLDFIDNEYGIDIRDANNLGQIKTSMVSSYIYGLKTKSAVKAARLYGIKSFFKYLINDDYITSNPCDNVTPPKDRKEHKITYLTKEEIEIVKNNILTGCGSDYAKIRQQKWTNRDYAIVMLGLSLGLRVASLTEINLQDIDFDHMEIEITEKGNKTRKICFGNKIKEVIIEWLKDRDEMLEEKGVETDALFISCQMTRMTSRSISRLVEKYTYNIDKHITPHKLRSTCATNFYNNTKDIYQTADVLGHSNISNTRKYVQIDQSRKREAAKTMDNILF